MQTKKAVLLVCGLVCCLTLQAQNQAGGKVGYASVEYIMSRMPEVKAIDADLQSTRNHLRTQIEARSQEVQKQYTDLVNEARTLPDTVVQRRQQEVEQAMAELEKMQQDAQQSLTNKQRLMMAPLYLNVNRVIREVAQEQGYDVILTEGLGGMPFLLYQDSTYNISEIVIERLGGQSVQD